MKRLDGPIRPYAWGSYTALAELTGRATPSDRPEAELWFGAHPADPAQLVEGECRTSLFEAIADDPFGQLGEDIARTYQGTLPFLLKVLAARQPLSLQAHPSLAQAREGFSRENAAGIALDSPVRNYRDDNHKPELIVALTKFEALAGFRDARRTTELLKALDLAALDPYVSLLAESPDASGVSAVFTQLMSGTPDIALVADVLEGCRHYLSRTREPSGEFVDEARTALELGLRYPGDPGVVTSLLLNRVSLEPGEGLYLPAGNLHAYLGGTGIEVMANSDNVLRGGLTPKHVDLPELLRVLDFTPISDQALRPRVHRVASSFEYQTPTGEFKLTRVELEESTASEMFVTLNVRGPRIVLCTAGTVLVSGNGDAIELHPGQAVWVPASDPEVDLIAHQKRAQVFFVTC